MIVKISIEELEVGMFIHDLDASWFDHRFIRTRFLLREKSDLTALIESGLQHVWIDTDRGEFFSIPGNGGSGPAIDAAPLVAEPQSARAIDEPNGAVGPQKDVSIADELNRAKDLPLRAKKEIRNVFDKLRLGQTICAEAMLPLVEEIFGSVRRHPVALISLVRMKSHDDYTYLHSLAVCALMIALARSRKMSEDEILTAGMAGLMHDIGKAIVDPRILNKPGPLTDEEWVSMRKHAVAGATMIDRSDGHPVVLDVALHHHERIDGKGYPDALSGNQISDFARMGAICDVYDAITSNRPYKKAWDPAFALRQMAKWTGQFDPRIFTTFVKTVGIYPVGSLVRLESQHVAVVVDTATEFLLKPIVRVFFSLRSKERVWPYIVDLASPSCTDQIVGLEDTKTWKFESIDKLWMSV